MPAKIVLNRREMEIIGDNKTLRFEPGCLLDEELEEIWTAQFGSLRPNAKHLSKILFIAIAGILEWEARNRGGKFQPTANTSLKLPFRVFQSAIRGSSKSVDKDREHYASRFTTECPAKDNAPRLHVKGNFVVWKTPCNAPTIEVTFKGPQRYRGGFFDVSRRCKEFYDHFWELLEQEISSCSEKESIECYVIGRNGLTFNRVVEYVSEEVKNNQLGDKFKQHFRLWIINNNRRSPNVIETIKDALPSVPRANLPTTLFTYNGRRRPSIHGCLIVKANHDRTAEKGYKKLHAFWDHWLNEQPMPTYRYLKCSSSLSLVQQADLRVVEQEMAAYMIGAKRGPKPWPAILQKATQAKKSRSA